MNIAGREIGPGNPPYIVAELAGEHRGDLERAYDLIRAAKDAGADAVKFQLYDPVALSEARGGCDKVISDGLWKGRTLFDLYTEAFTPMIWFPKLFDLAREIGITAFSSVFDEIGVDFLEQPHINCPAYKIASFEIRALALIRRAASTGKPLIISTGMGSADDIRVAKIAAGPAQPALLHCVSAYPCPIEEANLQRMEWIGGAFGDPVGFSDHTLGTTAAIGATALGARIIEKHITLDRQNGGPDAAYSLEPQEFAQMVRKVRDAHKAVDRFEFPPSENLMRELRR